MTWKSPDEALGTEIMEAAVGRRLAVEVSRHGLSVADLLTRSSVCKPGAGMDEQALSGLTAREMVAVLRLLGRSPDWLFAGL